MNWILAIDPGPSTSGVILAEDSNPPAIVMADPKMNNDDILLALSENQWQADTLLIEQVESYGMAVGADVFETVYQSGQFAHAWKTRTTSEAVRIPRKRVKLTLCQSMRAKDPNIRQAIIDRYPPTGGGRCPQIGNKAMPGPLRHVASHAWSALALIITYIDNREEAQRGAA
jgi:hypothetical protein